MKMTLYFVMSTSIMSVTSFVMGTVFTSESKKMMIEWMIINMESMNLEFSILLDSKSLLFFSCVMLITSTIILYSEFYMEANTKKSSFMKMIVLFVTSMTILIFSPNMISVLLGWEGLGMTSFVLIMFYQNKKSLMSAMYTMVMNRMGDIMLILGMINMMNLNSWSLNSTLFTNYSSILVMILMGAFSKSAQIPFSSWLTEAMAAPTPISALVHSSTLVTAGVYLMIRFELSTKYSTINILIYTISMLTLMMASINSLNEWDLKKLVALSTLSQLSLMFLTISINLYQLSMFHVLMHAMFKALIFLSSSTIISFNNTQDIRKMMSTNSMIVTMMAINSASLALCGFPFMAGFYSKDLIMEMMSMQYKSWMFNIIFYMSMTTTIAYSVKISMIMTTKKSKTKEKKMKETSTQIFSKMMLLIPTITLGNKMSWMFSMTPLIPQISYTQKIVPLSLMMTSMLVMEAQMMKTKKQKKSNMKKLMTYMWFLKSFGFKIKNKILINYLLTFKNSEKGVFNQSMKYMMNKTLKMSKMWFTVTHKKFSNINLMIILSIIMMM